MALQYRPLTDSFRELNRMLMEKQSWDLAQKNKEAEFGLKGLVAESQLKTAAQQQELTSYKLKEQERLHTPTTFYTNQIMPGGPMQMEEYNANPDWQDKMKRAVIDGDEDELARWSYSPADGTFVDEEGNPFQIAPKTLGDRLGLIQGINEGEYDQVGGVVNTLGQVTQKQREVDKAINKARNNNYARVGAGDDPALKELYTKKQELAKASKSLDDFLAPENLIKYYTEKAKAMRFYSTTAQGMGATELAAQFLEYGKQANADTRAMISATSAAAKAQAGAESDLAALKVKSDIEILKLQNEIILADKRLKRELEVQGLKGTQKESQIKLSASSAKDLAKINNTSDEVQVKLKIGSQEKVAKWNNETRRYLGNLSSNTDIQVAQMNAANRIEVAKLSKKVGKGTGGMTYNQAINKVAKDLTSTGPFGELTDEASKPVREMASIYMSEYANKNGIGPKDDHAAAYVAWNTTREMAERNYWDYNARLEGGSPSELLAGMSDKMVTKYGLTKKNIKRYLMSKNYKKFASEFTEFLPKGYPIYVPSKARETMKDIGK